MPVTIAISTSENENLRNAGGSSIRSSTVCCGKKGGIGSRRGRGWSRPPDGRRRRRAAHQRDESILELLEGEGFGEHRLSRAGYASAAHDVACNEHRARGQSRAIAPQSLVKRGAVHPR